MKLWSVDIDKPYVDNFPQITYKDKVISLEEETFLTNKLFDLFKLTHRDKIADINLIKLDKNHLPYKKLYHLIFENEPFEFETEYMVFLLNFFSVEID